MIEGLGNGAIGARAVGKVTADDYENILIPAVNAALSSSDKIRMMYVLGPGFEGYDADAALDDARMGMHHWADFEKIAVVTDHGAYRTAIKGFGFMMPGEVKVFGMDGLDDAEKWVSE